MIAIQFVHRTDRLIGDIYLCNIDTVEWSRFRDMVDWLSRTPLMAPLFVVQTDMINFNFARQTMVHGASVQLYSDEDVMLFKAKWTGIL